MLSEKDFVDHLRKREKRPPTILYKYLSIDGARAILNQQTLLFRSPLEYNDPFDSQWDPLWSVHSPEARKQLVSILEHAVRDPSSWPSNIDTRSQEVFLKEHAKIKELSNDDAKLYFEDLAEQLLRGGMSAADSYVRRIQDSRQRMRVCCFSADPDSILMWSHYAAEHQGVVIGFYTDRLELHFRIPFEQVEYCSNLPELIECTAWMNSLAFGLPPPAPKGHPRAWGLSKAKAWIYEQEWRLFSIAAKGTDGLMLCAPFRGEALAEIVLGCKTNKQSVREIVTLARSRANHISFTAMTRHPNRFELTRSPIQI